MPRFKTTRSIFISITSRSFCSFSKSKNLFLVESDSDCDSYLSTESGFYFLIRDSESSPASYCPNSISLLFPLSYGVMNFLSISKLIDYSLIMGASCYSILLADDCYYCCSNISFINLSWHVRTTCG